MEVVISIAGKIAEYMVEPVGRWLCYSFQYGSNVENLRKGIEELEGVRERVQHDVTIALNNCDEIETDVQGWLTEVDKITEKAREVLEGAKDAKSKSFNGKCLNLKPRHILSRKANKITQEIAEDKILEKGRFDRVSYRPTSQGIVATQNPDFLSFQSREKIAVELMEALKDTSINVIGVSGMGGAGKTTLVTEVGRQAKEDKVFNEVVMVDVTPNPNTKRIQEEIMDLLRLKFDALTERGIAMRLREKLANDKKILLVLDNIWKELDLEKIGIPRKGCKLLLISRNKDVLSEMKTEYFEIGALPEDEAWSLFEKMVGDSINGPDIRDTAIEVANKCAGLPIALVTVSKALKNRSLSEWRDALRRLARPVPGNLGKMESNIYSCIELSYTHLENQVQLFFLHCAQMPFVVFHNYLLKYCHGLGLFSGITTLEEARNNIYRLVSDLKGHGLLQDCRYVNCFRKWEHYHMHDVVRDVGRLIASKDHNMIVVEDNEGRKEWPKIDVPKRCEAFSLHRYINELPSEMELPELSFLLVDGKGGSLQISNSFFQGMRKLKVMDFAMVKLSSLPLSLLLLTNLQTLCLEYCELEDISIIGKLENLTILSLVGSNISELPTEIRMLTHLQLLDLRDCSKLEVVPPNILSRLVKLEDLHVGGTSIQWQAIDKNNASLVELKQLSKLVTLEIHIQDTSNLPKDLSFDKLERYKIFIGNVWDWSGEYETSKTLKLKMNISIHLEVEIKKLLKRTESLCLDELKGVSRVVHELDSEGFKHLKHLQIQNNPEIKYIVYSKSSVIAFPTLETLLLKNMINLEELCHGQLALTSFQNLRSIKIEHCDNLKFLISSSVASCLSKLENLEIRECSNMVAMIMKGGKIEGTQTTWFPKLSCLRLHGLPKLKGFFSIQNSSTTDDEEIMLEGKLDCYSQILQEEVVFPKLEELELSSIYWEEVQHKRQLARSSCSRFTSTPRTSRLQNLLSLIVRGSGNSKHLLSFSTAKLMVRLKFLEIRECSVIEEILLMEDLGVEEETIPKTLFPQLETLHLMDLPIIKWFCKGISIKFPSLKKLEIEDCPKFMTFICKLDSLGMIASKELKEISANESSYIVMEPFFNEMVVFPRLEELRISHIVDLKRIWHNQFAENSFCKLQTLEIEFCENLTNIFQAHVLARLQRLNWLRICYCESLQEVFELQGLNDEGMPAITAIPLKWLVLVELPALQHVWSMDPHPIFLFQELQEVYVRECQSLQSLFRASVARCLPQLEILSICDCGVEEIVAREDGAQAIDRLVFPRVTHLVLLRLPRLEHFHLGVYTVEWPRLKKIWVQGCPFDPTLSSFEKEPKESHQEISNKKLYFMVDKALAKCVDSIEEFAEDINNSAIDWKNKKIELQMLLFG